MAILIDQAIWPWRGRRWAHLVSDVSYVELHVFAECMGIPRRAFQGDHYDIPEDHHARAIELGAELVDARVLARRLREAGLRIDRRARLGASSAGDGAGTPRADAAGHVGGASSA